MTLWPDGDEKRGDAEKAQGQLVLGIIVLGVLAYFITSWETWQAEHNRKARLTAYRRRTRWRKADLLRLMELGIPRHRIERIIDANRCRGRGVVPRYKSLDTTMAEMTAQFEVLLSPETAPHARLATLKQTPLWPEIVEALYRGEHAAAKERRERSASTLAEELVARCLGLSDSSVRKVCVAVRKTRRLEVKLAESGLLLRVGEFEGWLHSGNLQTL
ncbi:MAG: hypothetical protein ACREFB_00865 [Stellaceae bacterium]